MNKDFGKVGVLYGGMSAEREVSLNSGRAVYQALIELEIDATLYDVGEDFIQIAEQRPFDIAFIALHGRGGEDGTIQAILDWLKIPYTGSGVLASAVAMDKVKTKMLWQAAGLPVLAQQIVDEHTDIEALVAEIGLPMAIKPALEGSSVGISKVQTKEQILPAIKLAQACNSLIMAEHWVEGDELTAAVLGDEVLPLIKITTSVGFYDYAAKYQAKGVTEYHCPCGLSPEKEAEIQAVVLAAAKVIDTVAWSRVDTMLDKQGQVWLLEINTVPGMTATSLVPKAAKQKGLSFNQLIYEILKISVEVKGA